MHGVGCQYTKNAALSNRRGNALGWYGAWGMGSLGMGTSPFASKRPDHMEVEVEQCRLGWGITKRKRLLNVVLHASGFVVGARGCLPSGSAFM